MAERDCPAVHVRRVLVQAELPDDRHHLGGERLVQLGQGDVVQRESRFGEGLGNGVDGADSHDRGVHAGGGEAHQPTERTQSQGGGALAGHDDHGGRAVAHLRRVAGGDAPAGGEHGLEPRHLGGIGVVADTLVGVERHLAGGRAAIGVDVGHVGANRHDLVGEAALSLGRRRAQV